MSGSSPTRARRCAPHSPSCPPPGRASSTRLAASSPGYPAALLRACGQRADAVPPPTRSAAAPPGLAEPLTGRELEVLRLIAAGSSNHHIAGELFVSLDTVKKHVTHLLGKLGAANRTEAAARGRQLGPDPLTPHPSRPGSHLRVRPRPGAVIFHPAGTFG